MSDFESLSQDSQRVGVRNDLVVITAVADEGATIPFIIQV